MPLSNEPIAVSVNFDSLNEAYGFPAGYRDPSFFEGMDRLLRIAERYNIPLSIYVIGKDLENKEIFSRVREWSQFGHEIGNHSWLHRVNLGRLSSEVVRDDICRAHDLIADCIEAEPVGFIAPAWATSAHVVETLIELHYTYDTSVFPSLLLYPAVIKNFLHHIRKPSRMLSVIDRPDWMGPITRPTRPFFADKQFRVLHAPAPESLLILPLPTINRLAPCIWHTTGFMFGWPFVFRQMERMLDTHKGFYYLLHPADFLGAEDLDKRYNQALYRMNISLKEKIRRLEEVFDRLASSPRPVQTMQELAAFHYQHHAEIKLGIVKK
jgi:peptidoglycan/xylan/chitin deacetylase (PgdA/CDA1 family)